MKARSITFLKRVFSLDLPSACYVQRELKIVLFTEYLKNPIKETDLSGKISGLLYEVYLLLKMAKEEHQQAYSFFKFSVTTTRQETTSQETTPKETAPQEITPQETTGQETTTQENIPQENAPQEITPFSQIVVTISCRS